MFLKSKDYFIYGLPLVVSVALFCLLNTVSPLNFGPMGILFVFIFLYVAIISWLYAMAYFILNLITKIKGVESVANSKLKRLYLIISVISLGPVFLLALNSIGQLGLGDFILVGILLSVTIFYVIRRANL